MTATQFPSSFDRLIERLGMEDRPKAAAIWIGTAVALLVLFLLALATNTDTMWV